MAARAPDPEREKWAVIAAHLHRLTSSPEWDMYQGLALTRIQEQLEHLATAKADFVYEQGVLHGMRLLLHLPEKLIAQSRRP